LRHCERSRRALEQEGRMQPNWAWQTERYNRDFRERIAALDWIEEVALVAEDEPCLACLDAAGKYSIDTMPATPIRGCMKASGCCCWMAVITPLPVEAEAA
jgi:hypothetical protein